MKKNIFKAFSILLVSFSFLTPVHASTQKGYVDATSGLIVRKDAGATFSKIGNLSHKTNVSIINQKKTADGSNKCPTGIWYYVDSGSISGYVCSQYIIITDDGNISSSEMANMTDKQFENYLKNQGFPNSYWSKLKSLHKAHPNWVFKAVNAKYTWSETLKQESVKGRSLYPVTSSGIKNGLQGYLDTGSAYYDYTTDKFKALDASTWFQANSQTISYYMDPRNFLTESGIFMFEDLKYYKSYQTDALVKKILYTDFYKDYIKYYMEAAAKYNVSPVYLAAFSRVEVGLNSGKATSGKAGTYNNVNYNGYYNFYNIGASSGAAPVYNGLAYSKEAQWTTPQKAIVGGAGWIVQQYISQGQYTKYFQKWNVSPTSTKGIWHQFMTDIRGASVSSVSTSASYKSMNVIDEALIFTIPVYVGMPSSTSLPRTGNPNNWLKDLKVDNKPVSKFSGSTTSYDLGTVDYSKSSINISSTTVNSNASVNISGTKALSVGKNTIKLVVTAQNGATRTYTLNITRKEQEKGNNSEEKPPVTNEPTISKILNNISIKSNNTNIYGISLGTSASTLSSKILKQNSKGVVKITNSSNKTKTNTLSTGDKVTISSNNETKTYQVVIYGDLNGDGVIDAKDLLTIRKYLLKEKSLSGAYLEAAKITKGSSVNAKDLLQLRKYLLKKASISQV